MGFPFNMQQAAKPGSDGQKFLTQAKASHADFFRESNRQEIASAYHSPNTAARLLRMPENQRGARAAAGRRARRDCPLSFLEKRSIFRACQLSHTFTGKRSDRCDRRALRLGSTALCSEKTVVF